MGSFSGGLAVSGRPELRYVCRYSWAGRSTSGLALVPVISGSCPSRGVGIAPKVSIDVEEPPRQRSCVPAAAPSFVVVSDLIVPEADRAVVIAGFGDRLGAVNSWPWFQGLPVWADPSDLTALVMVSWWDTQEAFAAYMGTSDHR